MLHISKLMVCKSAAGYYLGYMYADPDMGMKPTDFCLPYSRQSGYMAKQSAERALKRNIASVKTGRITNNCNASFY